MARKSASPDESMGDQGMDDSDDEPIPIKRDTSIFERKDSDAKERKDDEKKDDFEEDVFV
jgi:hypothetical protein